MLVGNKLDLV